MPRNEYTVKLSKEEREKATNIEFTAKDARTKLKRLYPEISLV
jgi:hypothetical protein